MHTYSLRALCKGVTVQTVSNNNVKHTIILKVTATHFAWGPTHLRQLHLIPLESIHAVVKGLPSHIKASGDAVEKFNRSFHLVVTIRDTPFIATFMACSHREMLGIVEALTIAIN